eukprot:3195996-Prymnesium_polylepis.1
MARTTTSRCHDWSGPRCEASPSAACNRKKRRLYDGALYRTLHVQNALRPRSQSRSSRRSGKCDLARGHVTWHDAKRFTLLPRYQSSVRHGSCASWMDSLSFSAHRTQSTLNTDHCICMSISMTSNNQNRTRPLVCVSK